MDWHDDYHQYRPFYSVVDTGSEYSIEKIAVNEKHLRRLVEQIKTILSPKIVALFGEKNEVQSAVQEVLQKPDWQFPIEDCHSESSIIYVIIKEQLVVVFFATSESFLMQKSIDRESIVVTLYRYLQDISPTILHCPSKPIIENFHSGPKNPFSAQANSKTVFHLGEQVNKEIICGTINTNTNILQRKCGTNFRALVLNDNNSNYFLHTKLETYERNDVDRMQESAKELQRLLMLMTFEHKPSNIEATVRKLSFSVTGSLLADIVAWHKQYTHELLKCRNYVHSKLANFTNDIVNYLIGKNTTRYLFLSGDRKYAFTDRASRSQLDDLVSFLVGVISEGCVRCVIENTFAATTV